MLEKSDNAFFLQIRNKFGSSGFLILIHFTKWQIWVEQILCWSDLFNLKVYYFDLNTFLQFGKKSQLRNLFQLGKRFKTP